jgi:hypothetical protein
MCFAQDKRSKTIPLGTVKSTGDKILSHPVEPCLSQWRLLLLRLTHLKLKKSRKLLTLLLFQTTKPLFSAFMIPVRGMMSCYRPKLRMQHLTATDVSAGSGRAKQFQG